MRYQDKCDDDDDDDDEDLNNEDDNDEDLNNEDDDDEDGDVGDISQHSHIECKGEEVLHFTARICRQLCLYKGGHGGAGHFYKVLVHIILFPPVHCQSHCLG